MGVGAFGASKKVNVRLRYVISVSCPHGGVVLVQVQLVVWLTTALSDSLKHDQLYKQLCHIYYVTLEASITDIFQAD